MPLDPAFIGRRYAPSRVYEVGREKIREFASAIGDESEVYRDPAAAQALGHPDVIAPPTFAIVISSEVGRQVVFDPELGLDYGRVVHGEQRFVHHRPIRAAAGNDILTTRVDVSTEEGELVTTAYSTLVARAAERS